MQWHSCTDIVLEGQRTRALGFHEEEIEGLFQHRAGVHMEWNLDQTTEQQCLPSAHALEHRDSSSTPFWLRLACHHSVGRGTVERQALSCAPPIP